MESVFTAEGFYSGPVIPKTKDNSSFEFLLDIKCSDYNTAYDYLHGWCFDFAICLSQEFGYPIEVVMNDKKEVIHTYCTTNIDNKLYYIDVRGRTDDPELFYEEFNDDIIYDKDFGLDSIDGTKIYIARFKSPKKAILAFEDLTDEIGAMEIINKYKKYYLVGVQKEVLHGKIN